MQPYSSDLTARILRELARGPCPYTVLAQTLQPLPTDATPRRVASRHAAVIKAVSRARERLADLAPGARIVTYREGGVHMVALIRPGGVDAGGHPWAVGA